MKRALYTFSKINLALIIIVNLFTTKTCFAEGEPGRYIDSIFPVLNETKDILFAQNKDLNGQQVDLLLDVYEPSADTQARRPLIIYMHAGSFQNGARTDDEAIQFSRYFAKRGYVTASVSYRLGVANLLDPVSHAEAIYRAMQDAKSAVRFLRANASQYKVDTSRIYLAGASAGAIASIQAAYLQSTQIPTYIDQNKLGGLDSGGNAGYSSKVHGVVNAFGAILDTTWITAGSAPIVSIHGEKDDVVPYKYANFGLVSLFGSYYIHQRAMNLGIKTRLQSFPNMGHGFALTDTGKTDTTYRVIKEFLYALTTGKDTLLTSVKNQINISSELNIFPNPANDFISISNNTGKRICIISIISLDGKQIATYQLANNLKQHTQIKLPPLTQGPYLLKLQNNDGNYEIKKLIIKQ